MVNNHSVSSFMRIIVLMLMCATVRLNVYRPLFTGFRIENMLSQQVGLLSTQLANLEIKFTAAQKANAEGRENFEKQLQLASLKSNEDKEYLIAQIQQKAQKSYELQNVLKEQLKSMEEQRSTETEKNNQALKKIEEERDLEAKNKLEEELKLETQLEEEAKQYLDAQKALEEKLISLTHVLVELRAKQADDEKERTERLGNLTTAFQNDITALKEQTKNMQETEELSNKEKKEREDEEDKQNRDVKEIFEILNKMAERQKQDANLQTEARANIETRLQAFETQLAVVEGNALQHHGWKHSHRHKGRSRSSAHHLQRY